MSKFNSRSWFILMAMFATAFNSEAAESSSQQKTPSTAHYSHQFTLSYELPIAGQLNIDEDPLIGIEYRRPLLKTNDFLHFSSAGYKTDSDKSGIATELVHLDIGSQYLFAEFATWHSFVELSVGATYGTEEYSISLLDREASDSYSEFGYKTSFAVGFDFHSGFGMKLGLNQFSQGIDGRTLGLSFSYSF